MPEPAWFTVPVFPPGFDVAVYLVIAKPPLEDGAVYATVADVELVAVATPIPGAPGLAADACAAIKNDSSVAQRIKIFLIMLVSRRFDC